MPINPNCLLDSVLAYQRQLLVANGHKSATTIANISLEDCDCPKCNGMGYRMIYHKPDPERN